MAHDLRDIEKGGCRDEISSFDQAIRLQVFLLFCPPFRTFAADFFTEKSYYLDDDEGSDRQNSPPPFVEPETVLQDLRIRPGYTSYESYIQRQLNKTLNPQLRRIWKSRDWDRKIEVFSKFFSHLKREKLISDESKALSIGARMGQEVEALKRVGVSDSIGFDLVPSPPLVVRGDFHKQPFGNDTFDFEFSNVFDHALYPEKFVGEIERTLKPGGVCVLHVALARRADKYSANDLYSVEPLKKLLNGPNWFVFEPLMGSV